MTGQLLDAGGIAAGVVVPQPGEIGVTNITFPPCDLRRYGGDPTGVAGSRTALTNASTSAAALGLSVLVAGGNAKYLIEANTAVLSPIIFRGGQLKPANAVAIALTGYVQAIPTAQLFDTSLGGTVTLGNMVEVYAEWWGAIGDAATDDGPAFGAAHRSLGTLVNGLAGGTLRLLERTYKIATQIVWGLGNATPYNIAMKGAGMNLTTLLVSATNLTPLLLTNAFFAVCEDFQIFGPGGTSTVPGVIASGTSNVRLQGFRVLGFQDGISTRAASINWTTVHCRIESNSRFNWDGQANSNEHTHINLTCGASGGFASQQGARYLDSNSMVFDGGDCEAVSVASIEIDATAEITVAASIHGFHFEGNTCSGGDLRLGATALVDGVSVTGSIFSPGAGNITPINALRCKGLNVGGCGVPSAYATSNDPILGATCDKVTILGNAGMQDKIVNLAGGSLSLQSKLFPMKDNATAQVTAGIYAGAGVPNNANGNNGDFYLRSDTPAVALQRIYCKAAGAWVGLV